MTTRVTITVPDINIGKSNWSRAVSQTTIGAGFGGNDR